MNIMRTPKLRPTLFSPASTLSSSKTQCYRHTRYQSTSSSPSTPMTAVLSPRWLSDVKTRIGRCIMFGIKPAQTHEVGSILQEISTDWRELVAGSEGFLTGPEHRGLFQQEVVWGEMDSMGIYKPGMCRPSDSDELTGHVNNVMYNRYAESARVNWTLKLAANDPAHRQAWSELVSPKGIGLILRSIKTDYKFPLKWPDRITVLHKLKAKPEPEADHFILDVLILSEAHRRPAARCVEDIVVYDYNQSRKSTLPSFMVDRFRHIFDRQEEAKKRYSSRVRILLDRVERLEKNSWDKPDAKEDLGSAATP